MSAAKTTDTPRIAIDATPVVAMRKGVGIFLERLLDALAAQGRHDDLLVYVDTSYAREAGARWPFRLEPVVVKSSLAFEILLPGRCRNDGVDVLMTVRDRTLCEPRLKTLAYLFEIPDYRVHALERRGASWKAGIAGRFLMGRFAEVAQGVSRFAVSARSTAQDLVDKYAVPASRIVVIPPGTDDLPARMACTDGERSDARARFTSGRPYVLHFATGDERDNSEVALRCFALAVARVPRDTALLLVGTRDRNRGALLHQAGSLGIADRVVTAGYLSEADLRLAYAGASVYFDPTLYEGFGFQLAEAMAAGVPVISSDNTSVPEIVGSAGLLFQSNDVAGFSAALVRVLSDEQLHRELVSKGTAQCRVLVWNRTATRLLEEMRSMANGRG